MKKTGLKMMSIAITGVLAIAGLTGCGSQNKEATQTQSEGGKKKIGMVVSTLNNPYFVKMKDEAAKKAKELGYDFVAVDSQNDASKERSNVDDLLQQGVSAIIINPTDSDAVGSAVKAANSKKVPVITVDRQANSGDVACQITSDNVKGGEMAAEFIVQKLGGKGKIVQIEGIPGASATRDRGNGFKSVVDKNPGLKIVASQAADFDRQKGLDVMQNIMQSTPEFDAVFAQNDEMAVGVAKALKGKKVIIVGFDGADDAENLVKSGDMTATIAQQPIESSDIAVENAVKAIKGESVQKDVKVQVKLFTK